MYTCGTDMVEESEVIICPQQRCREHDGMEGNIVLSHELITLNILWRLPPLFPAISVAGSDGEVTTENIYYECAIDLSTP